MQPSIKALVLVFTLNQVEEVLFRKILKFNVILTLTKMYTLLASSSSSIFSFTITTTILALYIFFFYCILLGIFTSELVRLTFLVFLLRFIRLYTLLTTCDGASLTMRVVWLLFFFHRCMTHCGRQLGVGSASLMELLEIVPLFFWESLLDAFDHFLQRNFRTAFILEILHKSLIAAQLKYIL